METKATMRIRQLAPVLYLAALLVILLGATAASPIATVSSAGNLQLSGNRVITAGIPTWPLAQGDEIATTNASAVIVFSDRSRMVLRANSRVKLEAAGDQTSVRILQGGGRFRLALGSRLQLFDRENRIPTPAESEVTLGAASGPRVRNGDDDDEPEPPKPPRARSNKSKHGDNNPGKGGGKGP
jgi:hypothetical protein